MAKISDKIKQLMLNDYYVVSQETDLSGTPVVFGKKVSIGRYNGKGIKDHYVKLYKEATDEGVKPSVRVHVYQDARRSETGILIQSTTKSFWMLAPTEDFDAIYPDNTGQAVSDSEFSDNFVPSKGYAMLWNSEKQKWNLYGFNDQDTMVLIGRHTQLKALDVGVTDVDLSVIGKEFDLSGVSTYFHANVVTSPDSPDVDVEDGVEITSGKYEGQPIKNAERVVFTPLGDVFAFDSIQTSH